MSDYTPTTEEVRDAVAYDGDFYESNGDWIVLRDDIAACFDRWLAAHDAEVYQRGREDEGREIAEAIFNEHAAVTFPNPTDPHRNGFFLGLQRARDIAEGFQRIAGARGDGAE